MKNMGLPLVMIYLLSTVGSVGGGGFSGLLMRKGMTPTHARNTAMLLCASCVVPIGFATVVQDLWLAVGIVGLAAAAHQGWSANIFTTVSDLMPKHAVASVVGIGSMFGMLGCFLFSTVIGVVLEKTGKITWRYSRSAPAPTCWPGS